jgi:DNA-directed RNA polymerase specialized sigma24 family protein
MHYPAAHTFGDAAPSHLAPERAPTDCNAYRDMETAHQGAFADPASKPFSSEGLTPTGGELRPCPAPRSPADQTERRLLAAISTGDRAAVSELYFLYFLQLANFFTHVVAPSAASVVEDLIVEAMFRIWHESAALAREASVHVSIMRIAYRCGCERLPADGHPNQLPTRPSSRNLGRDGKPESPWQSLHKILAVLPMAERAVIHLVYSGHSRQEVADILGMSCESVDAYLVSSRISLRPWLAERSVGGTEFS